MKWLRSARLVCVHLSLGMALVTGCMGAPTQSSADGDRGNGGSDDPNAGPGGPNGQAGAPIVDALGSSVSVDRSSATADGEDAITLTVVLRESRGGPAAMATATASVSGSNNLLEPTLLLADETGTATLTLRSTKAEPKRISVRVQRALLGEVDVEFNSGPVDATRSFVRSAPLHPRADNTAAATIEVALRDALDNPVLASVTLVAGGAGNSFASTTTAETSAGIATFSLRSSVAETKHLTATIAGAPVLRGQVRFVDEWFSAGGAPFGEHFGCSGGHDATVWVVTEAGGYLSTDAGARYEFLSGAPGAAEGLPAERCRAIDVSAGGVWVGYEGGAVWRRGGVTAAWARHTSAADNVRALIEDTRSATALLWLARSSSSGGALVMRKPTGPADAAWTDDQVGLTGSVAKAFVRDDDRLFVATDEGVFVRDADDTSWSALATPAGEPNALLSVPAGSGRELFVASDRGVERMPVSGGVWASVSEGLPVSCVALPCGDPGNSHAAAVTALTADVLVSPAVLYAAVVKGEEREGEIVFSHLVYRRAVGGLAWEAEELPRADAAIEALFVTRADSQSPVRPVAAQQRYGLSMKTTAWTASGAALPGRAVNDLTQRFVGDGVQLVAATDDGLFVSDDEGDTWRRASAAATSVVAAEADPGASRLMVGTHAGEPPQNGVFVVTGDRVDATSLADQSGSIGAGSAVPFVSAAWSAGQVFVTDGAALFARGATELDFIGVSLPGPPFPVGPFALTRLWPTFGDGGGLALGTDAGLFRRDAGGAFSRIGGAGFTSVITAGLATADDLFVGTAAGAWVLRSAGAATLLDAGGETAARAVTDVAHAPLSQMLWLGLGAQGNAATLYTMPADGSAAASAVTALPAVAVRRVAVSEWVTQAGTRRLESVAFDGGTGVFARAE